jgi:hypothetical protein
MMERLSTPVELEAALGDLRGAIAWPQTPDLSASVAARLAAVPAPANPWWRRSLPRSLLLAAAITLLVAGLAIGIRFGLDLLSIEFGRGPSPSATTLSSPSAEASAGGPVGANLGLGDATALESVLTEADFPVAAPAALGPPDAVYLGGPRLRGQVAFVYTARDDLPASWLLGGAGLLLTQNRGDVDIGLANKIVDSGFGTVERVNVGDDSGYWFAGAPHWFWYLAPDDRIISESRRVVGNTLAWQRGDILFRIEGAISLERALEIAESLP